MTNAYETDWYCPNALDELHQRNWRSRLSQLKAELREGKQSTQRRSSRGEAVSTPLSTMDSGNCSVRPSGVLNSNVKNQVQAH